MFNFLQCLLATWYLSVEMQMTLIAPIVIYIANKLTGKFIHIVALFLLIGIVLRGYAAYDIGLDLAEMDLRYDLTGAFMQRLYLPTHVRVIPYFTGIVGGYLLFSCESGAKSFNVNKPLKCFLWAYSIGHLASPLSVKLIIDLLDHNRMANVIVEVYGRVLWALSIVWIIVACQCGEAGLVKSFLSHKLWIPLGKLGLGIYLTHTVIQCNLVASSTVQTNFETFHMVREGNLQKKIC